MDTFYKKPGKIGATTAETWASILRRRKRLSDIEAKREVERRIADGRLVRAES